MSEANWRPTRFIRATLLLHALVVLAVVIWPDQWRWGLGVLLANHLIITLIGLWPQSHWLGLNWTRLPDAAAARGEIALTIDDGPDPLITPKVLDLLDLHASQATFFCVGEKAERYPDLCREIVRRGHAVENHSQHHHHHFALMGPRTMAHEVQAAQTTFTATTGVTPLFFRAPAGLRNPFLDAVLWRQGLTLASWSARGFDTRLGDARRVSKLLERGLRAGAILLLHDGNSATTPSGEAVILEVLPGLLKSAALNGLRWVTLRHALS